MKKILLLGTIALIFMAAGGIVAAQTATVKKTSGKVEVRIDGGWQEAKPGMGLPAGSMISTGFGGNATLEAGASDIYVKQLTRMSVDKLVRDENKQTTGIGLRVGTVQAQVRTAEGIDHDFRLKSSVSTAAVRGTELVFSTYRIDVTDGVVELSNLIGQRRQVMAGQSSSTTGFNPPTAPADSAVAGYTVVPYGSEGGMPNDRIGSRNSGSITISWE